MTREELIRLVEYKDGRWCEAVREKGILEGKLNEVLAGQAEMQQTLSKVLPTLADQSALLAGKEELIRKLVKKNRALKEQKAMADKECFGVKSRH